MRILHIRFKNLNSLAGEWEIDLTHPAFTSEGIFAITGPTGAGKTTILDAICLALYGRTPRLNKITKNGNEIMSRQTGECFAEVTFETQTRLFRCHWSQHRARKKPDGELQSPKHEISDAISGQIFETKIRGVAEQIESITGIDFDRFTRSMLLAQGGFAAFLLAAPDERAPILEQITGTEIYSQISIRVHECRSDEKKKLEILQSELSGMQLLSEEDERLLKTRLEQMLLQETDLNQQSIIKRQAIAWWSRISQLEEELHVLDIKKRDLIIRQEAFLPDLEKLESAKRALELSADYARLNSIRIEQENNRQNYQEFLFALPEQETKVRQAEETVVLANKCLEQKKNAQKEILLVIRKVRELDLKLREKEATIRNGVDFISELEKFLFILRTTYNENYRTLIEKRSSHEQVSGLLSITSAHEGLVAHFAGINKSFDSLRDLDVKRDQKITEIDMAETQKSKAIEVWEEREKQLQIRKKEFQFVQNALFVKGCELKKILADREIADWRNDLSLLKDRKTFLEKVSESVKISNESEYGLSELCTRHVVLKTQEEELQQQIDKNTEDHSSIEREIHLLEMQLSLLNKIQDLKDARCQLQDGEQCPLCGALEHPFAEGNIPGPDVTIAELNRVRADYKMSNDIISKLRINQAGNLKDLQINEANSKNLVEMIAAENVRIKEGFAILSVDPTDREPIEILQHLHRENENNLNCTLKIVQEAECLEKANANLRDSLEKIRCTVIQLERDTQTALHKKESAEQTVCRIKNECELLNTQVHTALESALQEVLPYGIEQVSLNTLDHIQNELSAFRDQWLTRQKQKIELEKQISSLEIQTKNQTEKISVSEVELKKQQDLHSTIKREQELLAFERRQIFGDKNADLEESGLSTAVETSEKQLESSRQLLNSITQEIGKLKSRIETIEKSMATRDSQLKAISDTFFDMLGRFGFSDEENYKAASLPENERTYLMQQAQQLTTEQTEIDAKIQDKTGLLETERKRQITDQKQDQLTQVLNDLENTLKTLQQEIGAVRQKLADNFNLRQKQLERLIAIDAQKQEFSRWDMLHELIGSADGKKYRNFAQGLTFELMVGHANVQLQKMTDRYLLIRDDGQPLELNVVDNYQAGEIRSTKNLSGGESFIVSLSLALGLSHMASKKVKVDSLFLDEGFGTLDDEALDTALETLAGLQQDGKLIGVISHVQALKERISTQIQVIPQTGGRSVISGLGCKSSKSSSNVSLDFQMAI